MWFFLAFVVVCFTMLVMFRMFIDMRRIEFQHNRLMQSDRRDYERYVEVKAKEIPKPALPDFGSAALMKANVERSIGYHTHTTPRTPSLAELREAERIVKLQKLEHMKQAELERAIQRYLNEDYDRFIEAQERKPW